MPIKTTPLLSTYFFLSNYLYPLAFISPRVRTGWKEKCLQKKPLPTDILIQAASVGESKLALLVAEKLLDQYPGLKITISTNTKQGKDILSQANNLHQIVYFPLDSSKWQKKFLKALKPKLVLILETEIWPSFFYQLKKQKIPFAIINGRMRSKTFSHYLFAQKSLAPLFPDLILAISPKDSLRFKTLFPQSQITTIPNLKFELLDLNTEPLDYVKNPLSRYFPPQKNILVLGSVRKEEEEQIFWLIQNYLQAAPQAIIALFPRHMERIPYWQNKLKDFKYILRSQLTRQVKTGEIILWDKIGELGFAYALAKRAFVGGSLQPLGGQNFLEPLAQGIIPFVGPYLDNFLWVGEELFAAQLVIRVKDEKELLQALLRPQKENRKKIYLQAKEILALQKGGLNLVLKQLAPLLRFYSS